MNSKKEFNPHITKRQLREKLSTGLPFSQEDVDNARSLAKMDGSLDSRTIYASIKRRFETEVEDVEATKEELVEQPSSSKSDEILDQINELLAKMNQEETNGGGENE